MIIPVLPPPKQVAVAPDVAFKRAIELQQSGDLAGSEKIYRAILKQYPKHFETLFKFLDLCCLTRSGWRKQPDSCAGRSNRNRIRRSLIIFSPGSSICSTVMRRRCNEPIVRSHWTLNSSTRGLLWRRGWPNWVGTTKHLPPWHKQSNSRRTRHASITLRGEITRWTSDDPRLAALEELAQKAVTLPLDDQVNLNFALGKAYADCGDIERAFRRQLEGAALQRRLLKYDEASSLYELRSISTLDAKWMARHQQVGDPSPLPIFILGMPR